MATLDELLALLPDNDVGAIDAADLRAVVEGIFELGAAVEARVSALELEVADLAGSVGTGVSVTGLWSIDTRVNATPNTKSVTCDTGIFDTASWLRFAIPDKNGADLTAAALGAKRILAQQKKDGSSYVYYDVTGVASDHGSYVEVPVTVTDSASGGGNPWGEAIVVFVI
jgi:hypothetical protein